MDDQAALGALTALGALAAMFYFWHDAHADETDVPTAASVVELVLVERRRRLERLRAGERLLWWQFGAAAVVSALAVVAVLSAAVPGVAATPGPSVPGAALVVVALAWIATAAWKFRAAHRMSQLLFELEGVVEVEEDAADDRVDGA